MQDVGLVWGLEETIKTEVVTGPHPVDQMDHCRFGRSVDRTEIVVTEMVSPEQDDGWIVALRYKIS